MKSKTSFFNKTLYFKNLALFWPIWLGYLLLTIIMMDGVLFFGFRQIKLWKEFDNEYDFIERQIRTLENATGISPQVIVIFVAALIMGMALYNYLYTSKSANMLHSLPITRTEHFGTCVLSGLTMLWIPQIISFILAVFICLANGITKINILGEWLFAVMALSFIAFSMVSFCALLTGQIFALPVYFFALNFLYVFARLLLSFFTSIIAFGFNFTDVMRQDKFYWLAPVNYLIDNVNFLQADPIWFEETPYYVDLHFEGTKVLVLYIVAAVVFYVVAFLFYKRRDIENAGDAITVGFVKPIFKWGVGIFFGFGGGMFLYAFFNEIDIDMKIPGMVILCLLIGILCYFFAQMYIDKNFRVFNKKTIKGCSCFCCFMIALFAGLNMYVAKEEKYIPNIDEIESAMVLNSYSISYEDDEISDLLDIHKQIIEKSKLFREGGEEVCEISIYYELKNGSRVNRRYNLPICDDSENIFDYIFKKESVPENFMTYIYGRNYEDKVTIQDARFDYYDEDANYINASQFGSEQAELISEAIKKDIEEGKLQKYNLYCDGRRNDVRCFTSDLYIGYLINDGKNYVTADSLTWENPYDTYYEVDKNEYFEQCLQFGKDCKNIINTLLELDVIKSEDDLYEYNRKSDNYAEEEAKVSY